MNTMQPDGNSERIFRDRAEAGQELALRLERYRGSDTCVLALARGGVPVGFEVAKSLRAPLDIILVRKIGDPYEPELAAAAVVDGQTPELVINEEVASRLPAEYLAARQATELDEIERRREVYLHGKPRIDVKGRTVILVDDGIATGSTIEAAARWTRRSEPRRLILAVPVAPPSVLRALRKEFDEVVCLQEPADFLAIGVYYQDFRQLSDADVRELVERSGYQQPVRISAAEATLDGDLTAVADARGLVIFVHGSGSSRFSPRNRHVARVLNERGFTTLLADLLTAEEDIEDQRSAGLRFNIPLLAERTVAMIGWARTQSGLARLPLGLFGASTGAAAAIIAAVERPRDVDAIVSRGGRVDLAGEALAGCRAPLLMIVGSEDEEVERLHRAIVPRLECENRLVLVPGATHLFEESGALDAVAELASEWFEHYLRPASAAHV